MTDIEKKAYETYPKQPAFIPQDPYPPMEIDANAHKREGYIKCAEEYKSLPKIPGWVARDTNGCLCLHFEKPQNNGIEYISNCYQFLDTNQYPEVTWESGPLEVELLIRKV